MRLPFLLTAVCGALVTGDVMAEACVIHSHDDRVEVTLCQANINIPAELFRSGFCQPQLKDHEVKVEFVEQCPDGAFGICRNAQVSNMPYRQDIHYYGVASDARFLQPACEQNSQGAWADQ
ncbi:NADH:ubiquinone oxidoreductase [Pseudomonas stutzeri]|uniref:NADH:ubiquinone oxidoreductase n=1 Tax=Stutzerimonas stutzeri TaxID=316 RepID=A0A2N8RWS3_STUST|nr:NADH:ubiquinone oxidoreductase [Stutzerimonas stutzeri]MCQ4297943.1 NADH:ubiquinone oxidoreductase [Stutzerimonas stutzeri]PNF78830.1 NADH:ubiquinone oxidoreductase [Stutzerimonas stutzeri]